MQMVRHFVFLDFPVNGTLHAKIYMRDGKCLLGLSRVSYVYPASLKPSVHRLTFFFETKSIIGVKSFI